MEKNTKTKPNYQKRYDLYEFECITFERHKAHKKCTDAIYDILLHYLEDISPIIEYPAYSPHDVIRVFLAPTNPPGCSQIRLQRYNTESQEIIKDLGWIWDLLPEFINDFEDLAKWVLCREENIEKEARLSFI